MTHGYEWFEGYDFVDIDVDGDYEVSWGDETPDSIDIDGESEFEIYRQ